MARKKKTNIIDLIKWQNKEPVVIEYKNKDESETIHITIKPQISFADRTQMVKEIADIVMDEADNEYRPEFRTFALRYTTIKYFSDVTLPEDIEVLETLIRDTSLYEDIERVIGRDKLFDIEEEADELVKMRVDSYVSAGGMRALITVLDKFLITIGDKIKNIDATKLNEVIGKLQGVDSNKVIETILDMQKK